MFMLLMQMEVISLPILLSISLESIDNNILVLLLTTTFCLCCKWGGGRDWGRLIVEEIEPPE